MAFSKLLMQQVQCIQAPAYKVLLHQLTKSGTSIGANVSEAQSAESLSDFLHKMKMADKELNETLYWISLMKSEFPQLGGALQPPLAEIQRILKCILLTSTRKLKSRKQRN